MAEAVATHLYKRMVYKDGSEVARLMAELLNLTGEIGTLAVGTHADLLVVDGDPLADLGVLAEPKHFRHIIQGGAVVSGT
ncbi:hypothetical protein [Streptomyces ureilyticus]|uniref:hypothetical protein n=1 Tax=Streptomyces ureilyticus TaxID=1775131 RepID=UPI002E281B21|nr:hypothetical protein [Streptomyces ureilyticus]